MAASALPAEAVRLPGPMAAVLVAVMVQKNPTIRSVAEYAECDPVSAHKYLRRLRLLGFVSYEDNRAGTLRALVTLQQIGAPHVH